MKRIALLDHDDLAAPDITEAGLVDEDDGIGGRRWIAQHRDGAHRRVLLDILEHQRAAVLEAQDGRQHVAQARQLMPRQRRTARLKAEIARDRDDRVRRRLGTGKDVGAIEMLVGRIDAEATCNDRDGMERGARQPIPLFSRMIQRLALPFLSPYSAQERRSGSCSDDAQDMVIEVNERSGLAN